MKKLLLSASAIVAVAAISSSAFAADLPARTYTKAPAYTAPALVYNWTGFYIGGHLGGAFGDSNSLVGDSGRFMGGVQGGFDYQFATNWVVGVEAQYSWLASSNTSLVFPNGTTITGGGNDQLGSVTGRLGYTWGPALLYAKGGYAWKDNNNLTIAAVAPAVAVIDGNKKDGYTVGGGLEYMFSPNWSGKVEYQYYNFGNTTITSTAIPGGSTSFNNDEHTIKAGLNYRFGWGGPVVAKY
ncbi:outer membrane protein [Tardiphaga sp. 709]|uniref:outer membrane protein n=1 Tax=Tardiphaga sp. 709 TaxID=3076039 RepID=UPI0028EA8F15|nr:outer membrane beta-barrel protein [Tardiphaga sp. 709]WNV10789.1 outer membrane beta-barrel protein [Tardiphaga sp. 709]